MHDKAVKLVIAAVVGLALLAVAVVIIIENSQTWFLYEDYGVPQVGGVRPCRPAAEAAAGLDPALASPYKIADEFRYPPGPYTVSVNRDDGGVVAVAVVSHELLIKGMGTKGATHTFVYAPTLETCEQAARGYRTK